MMMMMIQTTSLNAKVALINTTIILIQKNKYHVFIAFLGVERLRLKADIFCNSATL